MALPGNGATLIRLSDCRSHNSGPRPGWRQRARSASPNHYDSHRDSGASGSGRADGGAAAGTTLPGGSSHGHGYGQEPGPRLQEPTDPKFNLSSSEMPTRDTSPSPEAIKRHTKGPLMGLSTALVDELLAVYFTHVHVRVSSLCAHLRNDADQQNVWPLIYKPLFHIQTTSPPLLLAMLAIASCVAQPDPGHGVDGEKLFQMAERSMHHCRMEARIDLIQSLILLSLRQTGCGDKHMAFSYAGRACCMALNLGLNLAPANSESPVSRVIGSPSPMAVVWARQLAVCAGCLLATPGIRIIMRCPLTADRVRNSFTRILELLCPRQDAGGGDWEIFPAAVPSVIHAPAIDERGRRV